MSISYEELRNMPRREVEEILLKAEMFDWFIAAANCACWLQRQPSGSTTREEFARFRKLTRDLLKVGER